MRKTLSVFFVVCASALAQPIGAGLKLGLPLTDAFEVGSAANRSYASKTKRWIIGPQFELRLPAGFAIEFDALYTQLNFSSVSGVAGSVVNAVTDADSWEFPLLLKYKFGGANAVAGSVRPFVSAGASFRRITDVTTVGDFITGNNTPELQDRNSTGFVVGGGVEIRALFIRVSPEFRFTRWGVENFRSGLGGLLDTNVNQGQFLVGISF